ncbi:MAG: glycosyltransferase [Coprobacter sp.]|nr:glycosyltransferase [Coprobacter sp.]
MLSYSIAIRTLGKSGELLRQGLHSVAAQTVPPERVLVYIAEGYDRPGFTVGREEYIRVKKGMVAQRILPYDEISSDVIFMLDDDVQLAPDSAERMLKAMEEHDADCIGADTFKNQDMTAAKKIYAAVTNLVFPHCSGKWAFKIRRNGSFSYNNRPTERFYWSQSCAGNALMWRKNVYRQLHLEDEMWLDELPFAYGDDTVETYKVYRNGFRLGVLYESGCEHLDGKTSSGSFRKGPQWIRTRTIASYIIWWRTIYRTTPPASAERYYTALCFAAKSVWLFFIMCALSLLKCTPGYIVSYIKGWNDGRHYIHTESFRSLRNYVLR